MPAIPPVGANEGSRHKIRFLGFDVSQHHFVRNMFIRPHDTELADQGIKSWEEDLTVINACGLLNDNWEMHDLNSEVFVAIGIDSRSFRRMARRPTWSALAGLQAQH